MKPVLLFIVALIAVWGCSNPFANQQLSMSADPGVTEAWLSLHVDGVRSGADYMVQRDGTTIFKGRLQSPDTVVYDSLLTPATTYTYRFYARENGDNSPALQSSLTTLDTTSHNFSWQSYEFGGQHGSSSFYDVAIIDENDIWAVGEIHTDSTDSWNEDHTQWLQPYNAAHWDGQKWELKRIETNACGGVKYPSIKSIYSFKDGVIVFGHSDGSLSYCNGKEFRNDCATIYQVNVTANKIWGTSSSDFYVVGNSGMIAHYDGTRWRKIESGTDLPIQDIYGSINPLNGETEILCVASDIYYNRGSKLLKIKNGKVTEINKTGLSWSISGVWFIPLQKYIVIGDGVNIYNQHQRIWVETPSFPNLFGFGISGAGPNNVLVCGSFGLLAYYNGVSWKNYRGKETPAIDGEYLECDNNENILIACGYIQNRAALILGRR